VIDDDPSFKYGGESSIQKKLVQKFLWCIHRVYLKLLPAFLEISKEKTARTRI
jgi:hypothetical protein